MQTAESRHDVFAIAANATQQFVIVHWHAAFDDPRMVARQVIELSRYRRLRQLHRTRATGKNDPREFIAIAFGRIDLTRRARACSRTHRPSSAPG